MRGKASRSERRGGIKVREDSCTVLTKFQRTTPSRIMRTVPLIFDVPLCTPRDEPVKWIGGYLGSHCSGPVKSAPENRLELDELDEEEGDELGDEESGGSRTCRSTSMSRTASVKSSSKKFGLRGPALSEENWWNGI